MGSEIDLRPGQPAQTHMEVLGTGPLRWIEVLRADLDRPNDGFSIVQKEWFAGFDRPSGKSAPSSFTLDWSDATPPANGVYYVRVRQRDLVHGRVAEAWSSPVWVQHSSAWRRAGIWTAGRGAAYLLSSYFSSMRSTCISAAPVFSAIW